MRLKVVMAIAGTSRTTAIHGSISCVRPRATSSVTRPSSSGHLADWVAVQNARSPGARSMAGGAAPRPVSPSWGRDEAIRAAALPTITLPPIHRIRAQGDSVASCHRSSPRWPMAVVARIPAASAPTNAPTNEMVGATIGWSLRRIRAMATHIPKPSTISTPTTRRNCWGVMEPSGLPEMPK